MLESCPLHMPVELPIWALVGLNITRPELHALLGEPHFVETDPTRTCGGLEEVWAYQLNSGQRFLIVFDVTKGWAELLGDPPSPGPLIQTLGLSPDDQRLRYHDAVEMQ